MRRGAIGMSESEIVLVDELLAMGCEEVVSQKGRKAYVNGEEVIAIVCIGCNSLKVRSNFGRNNSKFLGVNSRCKECEQERNRKYRQENPEKEAKRARKWYQENPEKAAKSARKWAEANREKEAEHKRKYYEANREKVAERGRKWRQDNPEMYLLKDQRRRARKAALPDDLTAEQQVAIYATFDGKCALTGEPTDLHLDHVIPISIGHGGTIRGNMIPLSATLNTSKSAQHIFEWHEANRERFNLSQHRFDSLIEYLAKVNDMSKEEYRAYVDWCFDNPRDVGDLQTAV